MAEWLAGRVSDFDHDGRRIIKVDGREVAVFRNGGRYHAMSNYCLHMGGPVGEGILLGKVEAVLDEGKRCVDERFSDDEIHIICPWHGWEYNIESGEFAGDRKKRLPTYDVAVRGDEVYVRT